MTRFDLILHIYIYIRRLNDINVQACACDSLYRSITKLSFFAVLERWLIYNCEPECSLPIYLLVKSHLIDVYFGELYLCLQSSGNIFAEPRYKNSGFIANRSCNTT